MVEKPERGEIELAKSAFYEATPAYIVGMLAVHKNSNARKWRWRISHIATGVGLPSACGRNLDEALRVARALNSAIDWSTIRRGETVEKPIGFTERKGQAVAAMIQSFSFLRDDKSKARADRPGTAA